MNQTPEKPDSPIMPPPPAGSAGKAGDASEESGQPLPPPPSVGKQVAQLIIIPAVIVIACVGLSVMFGLIAGGDADIDAYLSRLRQSGGQGRIVGNIQDPRYKDRGLAAYNIATMIPKIDDAAERKRVSDELIDILKEHISPEEELIHVYLLLAVGQLGQEGGLDALIEQMASPKAQIRQGAVGGVMNWPDRVAARKAIPALTKAAADNDPLVVLQAAAILGVIATPEDATVIEALKAVIENIGSGMREAKWNAAVALARLGDAKGSAIVATILLDREALAKLPDEEARGQNLSRGMQDRVILSTLSAADKMTDPQIWDRITTLAEQDTNGRVRKTASQLLLQQRESDK